MNLLKRAAIILVSIAAGICLLILTGFLSDRWTMHRLKQSEADRKATLELAEKAVNGAFANIKDNADSGESEYYAPFKGAAPVDAVFTEEITKDGRGPYYTIYLHFLGNDSDDIYCTMHYYPVKKDAAEHTWYSEEHFILLENTSEEAEKESAKLLSNARSDKAYKEIADGAWLRDWSPRTPDEDVMYIISVKTKQD